MVEQPITDETKPSYDRYEKILRGIFGAYDDQKYAPREQYIQNIDALSCGDAFDQYKRFLEQEIAHARSTQSFGLDWDIHRAFQYAAEKIDSRFATATDTHNDAVSKREAGKNQMFKNFFEQAIYNLHHSKDKRT
ncbi:MAG: hypothetical protein AAB795_03445 [Patescibacteria group bacterium]